MKDRLIVLDTETTGLSYKDGDRVIEIGCVEVRGNMLTGEHYHVYINPGRRKVHPDAMAVHGITDEFLADKPTIDRIIHEFLDFIADSPIVIHNAPFDMGMLNNELELLQKVSGITVPTKLENEIIDSLTIARQLYPMARNSLDGLCARFGIDKSSRTYHGALIDADLLAQVYIDMMGYSRLDLGDHPLRKQSMNMAVEALVSTTGNRPVRPARPALFPSEAESELHAAFVDKKLKNPLWAKFF